MTARRHRAVPRIWASLLLLPAALGRTAFGGDDEAGGPRLLSYDITEVGFGLEVEGESERRQLNSSSATVARDHVYIAPVIDLGVRGAVYHPNLLRYDLKLEDGIGWQEQSFNQNAGAFKAGTDSKTQFLQRYHGDVTLLAEKPYATTFFADKDHNFRQFDFFNQATVDNTRYGGRTGFRDGPLPFSFDFCKFEETISGFTRPGSSDETTMAFSISNERARDSRTALSYTYDDYLRREEGLANQAGLYQTASLSDAEAWGRDNRYRLNSSVFYSEVDKTAAPSSGVVVMEHGSVDHTKNLASTYDYSYNSRSQGSADSDGHAGQVALRYDYLGMLVTAPDVHGETYKTTSPEGSMRGHRYGVGLTESFTRHLTHWCDTSLSYGGRFDKEALETRGRTIPVVDEQHTLTDGVATFLNLTGADPTSIRVTDGKGFIYPASSYLVINHGALVEIQRSKVATGPSAIPNGGSVFVDYIAVTQTSGSYTVTGNQVQLRFDFFNHLLGLYGRLNWVENHGEKDIIVQNVADKVGGADVTWRWVHAGAEYELYDSNLAPQRSKRLFESFSFDLDKYSTLGFDFDQSWTTYLDSSRHRTTYNFMARYNNHLTSHLTWSLDGGWRSENGKGFDQSQAVVRTVLQYTRGKLSAYATYSFENQDYLGEMRTRHFFSVRLKRVF